LPTLAIHLEFAKRKTQPHYMRDTTDMTTGSLEAKHIEAADLLLNARRTATPIDDLPADLKPVTLEEAYAVQDLIAAAYGPIGGWKIGAPTPDATPIFAPMPKLWIAASGSTLSGVTSRYRGLEAEIAFQLGEDLPPRATHYSLAEVIAAIGSCHPVIEVIESGISDPARAEVRMSMLADLQMHGGFIYGPACADWQAIDFSTESVSLAVDGVVRVERTGSNTSGNLMRLLPYLANEGAARTGGLKRGQWITTGSWTGLVQATAGADVKVHFSTAGRVDLCFA
jgi:2-keto-4-pentenoate hydratase